MANKDRVLCNYASGLVAKGKTAQVRGGVS